MKLAYGNTPVKATTEVLSKMYETNLSQEYNAALMKYASTDSLSKNMLEQLGQSLSVNYILTSRLGNDQQYNSLDINNQNKGNAAIDEMFLQSQVWDTKTGQVVWEGMGGVAASKSYPINSGANHSRFNKSVSSKFGKSLRQLQWNIYCSSMQN
jgi:hypothetical protein